VVIACANLTTGVSLQRPYNLVTKHNLPKSKVRVFLSDDFSENKPSELLSNLVKVADVRIVCGAKLHAKLIALHTTTTTRVLVGSANLTWSGVNRNLELTTLSDEFPKDKINQFLFICDKSSIIVNDDLIAKYRNIEAQFVPNKTATSFADFVRQILNVDSTHLPSPTLLKDQYFTYDDYETLLQLNSSSKNDHIHERRETIRKRLLAIHNELKGFANSLDVHEHWKTEHVTSLITPCLFNGHRVTWVGLRYGKSEACISHLSPGYTREHDEQYSFPKHACIQLALYPNGFAVSLFHAVREKAWDRAHVRDRILKTPGYMDSIIDELHNLKGHGYVWTIDNPFTKEVLGNFDLDNEDMKDFRSWYMRDADGYESSLQKTWIPESDTLRSLDMIVEAAKEQIQLLQPLYRKMAQITVI
jgi:hypothetical protein